MNKFQDVDIGIGMGNNYGGGGRKHGYQILKERAGSYPMRKFSLPNRYTLNISQSVYLSNLLGYKLTKCNLMNYTRILFVCYS